MLVTQTNRLAFPATVYVVKAQLTKDFAGSLPLPINDRSSTSRASSNRTYASFQSRRASSAQGCRGIAVSGSRAGAARAAAILLLSYHVLPSDLQQVSRTRIGIDTNTPDQKLGSMLFSLLVRHCELLVRLVQMQTHQR